MPPSNQLGQDVLQRLYVVENHIENIKDDQQNYKDALKELALNMNQMAIAMAEREQDRTKLNEVSEKIEKLQEDFSDYKEKQYQREIADSKKKLWNIAQFFGSIALALIIFYLTKDITLVPGH